MSDGVAVKEAVEACDSVTGHNHLSAGWTGRSFSKLEMVVDRLGPRHSTLNQSCCRKSRFAEKLGSHELGVHCDRSCMLEIVMEFWSYNPLCGVLLRYFHQDKHN
jgi:hypothetical protein